MIPIIQLNKYCNYHGMRDSAGGRGLPPRAIARRGENLQRWKRAAGGGWGGEARPRPRSRAPRRHWLWGRPRGAAGGAALPPFSAPPRQGRTSWCPGCSWRGCGAWHRRGLAGGAGAERPCRGKCGQVVAVAVWADNWEARPPPNQQTACQCPFSHSPWALLPPLPPSPPLHLPPSHLYPLVASRCRLVPSPPPAAAAASRPASAATPPPCKSKSR